MPRGSAPGERRGGRQKGVRNSKTRERIAAAESSGLLPHEFLAAVARGETFGGETPDLDQRIDAAKAAASFYAPKLASVANTHANPDGSPMAPLSVVVNFVKSNAGHTG